MWIGKEGLEWCHSPHYQEVLQENRIKCPRRDHWRQPFSGIRAARFASPCKLHWCAVFCHRVHFQWKWHCDLFWLIDPCDTHWREEVQEELLEDDLEVPDALSTEKDDDFDKEVKLPAIREFKKLRRQLQRKRHIKIELCVIKLSLLRLFRVDHIVQNRRTALSLAWHEWFSWQGKEWKIYCCKLTLLWEPQMWKFHVVVWQTTSKHCTKRRAARLFFFIQPIKSMICGVVVDFAVVKS